MIKIIKKLILKPNYLYFLLDKANLSQDPQKSLFLRLDLLRLDLRARSPLPPPPKHVIDTGKYESLSGAYVSYRSLCRSALTPSR